MRTSSHSNRHFCVSARHRHWLEYDREIDRDKYYVYSFRSGIPCLPMLSWSSLTIAKRMFRTMFGPRYKDYVGFIKGSDITLGDFLIFPYWVQIRGRMIPMTKLIIWSRTQMNRSPEIQSYLRYIFRMVKTKDIGDQEKELSNLLKGFTHGRLIEDNRYVKRAKLRKVQEAVRERQRVLYIDPTQNSQPSSQT